MFKKLFNTLKRPSLYEPSTCKFWDDEHISKGMLEAHLHPEWDAASRNHVFIGKSVEWISEIAPARTYNKLLDLGCGPGLYAERFNNKGYDVTGIDFSRRSISYAKEKANEHKLNINYIYKNYLEIEYKDSFDIITLVYCDFGVLSDENRKILLKKIYNALKPGGKFILDVFTPYNFEDKNEDNTWNRSEGNSFWKAEPHIVLQSHLIYENDVRLDQHVIIDQNDNIDIIRNWFKMYTRDSIIAEIENAGFNKYKIYSDVAGTPYYNESKTMCIVVEK